ncbi:amidohydrolase [Aquibium sp. A9E412]|uniref:amidohydrolase n=1 Tax=Aquibium sp. A9E412 TaxID=2976767 RepID=UPI0025B0D830|nr:amidohydrolase [Aquibium sp. A9E412]MDN2566966.1 amidohydrolase [Aquibium sp. A9E412]
MSMKTLAGPVLGGLLLAGSPAAADAPDTIYFGGPIVTMKADALFAEAVAVRDDRIIAVDMLESVRAMADEETEMVDLEGRTLLPGFIDAHGHFLGAGMSALSYVDLNPPPIGTVTSIDDLVDRLGRAAGAADGDAVILGRGYDDTLLAEKRHPTRADLDRVSTEVPVVITHISGHLAVGNSAALARAGITAETADPDGGRIRKDAQGEPTGVMEGNANGLLRALAPAPDTADWVAAIGAASDMWAASGFTTASDNLVSPDQLALFRAALEAGEQTVRVNYWPRVRSVEAVRAFPAVTSGTDVSDGRLMLTQGPVKFTIDGSPQGYTAHFTQPYTTLREEDEAGYSGFPYWNDRAAFFEIVETLHRDGYQMTIHGNGDQGIQDVIDGYAAAQRAFPRDDARHGVIHAQFARPDQLDQMAALGITPSFFIGHTFYWGDRHKNVFFGPHRAAHMSPLAGARDRALRFSTHTDTPVTPIDGIQMLWSSVNRVSAGGETIGAGQRIDPLDALKAITVDAAWQVFEDDVKGTIEPGKLADFVILSDNPLSVGHADPDAIKDIKVLETIVGGRSVFEGETTSIVSRHFAAR